MFWRYSILGRKNAPLRPFIQFKIDKYFKADTYLRYTSGPIVITYQNGEFSCQNEVLSPSEQIAVLEKQIGEVCLSTTKKLGYADFNELGDKEFSFLFANCRTLLYIPAHIHTDMNEAFYVLEGELEITLDGVPSRCQKDNFIYVEKGTSHELKAITDCRVMTVGCEVMND